VADSTVYCRRGPKHCPLETLRSPAKPSGLALRYWKLKVQAQRSAEAFAEVAEQSKMRALEFCGALSYSSRS